MSTCRTRGGSLSIGQLPPAQLQVGCSGIVRRHCRHDLPFQLLDASFGALHCAAGLSDGPESSPQCHIHRLGFRELGPRAQNLRVDARHHVLAVSAGCKGCSGPDEVLELRLESLDLVLPRGDSCRRCGSRGRRRLPQR